MDINPLILLEKARSVRKNSYSRYSGFSVGAALLGGSGKIYTGVNIENASFSATICAERSALSAAISAGERSFCAIAIVGNTPFCYPCGVCRQVLSEFASKDFIVITEDRDASPSISKFTDLFPCSFTSDNIDNTR